MILALAAWIQFSVVSRTTVDAPFRADSREYFFSAYNLVHHGVYSRQVTVSSRGKPLPVMLTPDSVRSPGYPLFLALLGTPEPTGSYLRRVTRAQAALGVLSVWLLFLISKRFLRPGWSHAAALLTALSPHLAVMNTYLLSESLFTFLLFVSTYLTMRMVPDRRPWLVALTGFTWGLCSLVRPTMQLLPVVALAAIVVIPRLRPYLRTMLLAFGVFALLLAPWMIRNSTLDRAEVKSSLMTNFVLHGSYPGFMYKANPATYGDPYRLDPAADALALSLPHTLGHIGRKFQESPIKYLSWYLIGKPGFFLSWTNIDGAGDIFVYSVSRSPYLEERAFDRIRQIMFLLHWPLMLLGLASTVLLWLRPDALRLEGDGLAAARVASVVVLYAIGLHMIGAPYPRYGIPFRVLLFPLALIVLQLPWKER